MATTQGRWNSIQCAAARCHRQVRLDNAFAPFCTEHVRLSPRWVNSHTDMHRRAAALRDTPPVSATVTDTDRRRTAYLHSTPISEDLIGPVLISFAAIAADEDLSIPSTALRGIRHRAENLAADLILGGIPSTRVELLDVLGIRLRTDTGWHHDPSTAHTVVLLDRHRDSAVIVDPSVAAFAPVPNPDVSVHDQLAGQSTPFGDIPHIASLDDYLDGDHRAWDSHSVRSDLPTSQHFSSL